MKRIVSLITVALILACFATPALAMENNSTTFELNIDFGDTAEQIYVIDGIEFKVLAASPVMSRAALDAHKTVEMRDLVNDAKLGSVYIYATGVYDGTFVAVSNYGAYVIDKPSTSDLRTTGTSIKNNGSTLVTVSAGIAYTGSNGRPATGTVNLFIKGDGSIINP